MYIFLHAPLNYYYITCYMNNLLALIVVLRALTFFHFILTTFIVLSDAVADLRMSTDDEEPDYMVYEVIEFDPLLESENLVVAKRADDCRLLTWSDLKPKHLQDVDLIKKGDVDIIRCGNSTYIHTHIILSRSVSLLGPRATQAMLLWRRSVGSR